MSRCSLLSRALPLANSYRVLLAIAQASSWSPGSDEMVSVMIARCVMAVLLSCVDY